MAGTLCHNTIYMTSPLFFFKKVKLKESVIASNNYGEDINPSLTAANYITVSMAPMLRCYELT